MITLNVQVNELTLVLANHISDKVIDDVIDGLSKSYKALVGDMGSFKKKRSLTPDVLKVRCRVKGTVIMSGVVKERVTFICRRVRRNQNWYPEMWINFFTKSIVI